MKTIVEIEWDDDYPLLDAQIKEALKGYFPGLICTVRELPSAPEVGQGERPCKSCLYEPLCEKYPSEQASEHRCNWTPKARLKTEGII